MILEDVQEGRCFYCRRRLRDTVAVDHFVPWRRYPFDLAHNFVLAHDRCNGRKGDRLAAVPHLERWAERNYNQLYELTPTVRGSGAGPRPGRVGEDQRWAYQQVAREGGQVWVKGNELVRLGMEWEGVV